MNDFNALMFVQEDKCLDHENNHGEEYFGFIIIGRDAQSVDNFGNTISCDNRAFEVDYYGEEEEETGASTAAIIAAFLVSFSILSIFAFAVLWPRCRAYMKGQDYDSGAPLNETQRLSDGEGSGHGLDTSTTPFTHAPARMVANARSSTRGSSDDRRHVEMTQETGQLLRGPNSSDGADLGKFHAII